MKLHLQIVDTASNRLDDDSRQPHNALQDILNGQGDVYDLSRVRSVRQFDIDMQNQRIGLDSFDSLLRKHGALLRPAHLNQSEFLGVVGFGSSRVGGRTIRSLAELKKPIVAVGARNSYLSDRKLFPYFWRLTNPMAVELSHYGHVSHLVSKNLKRVTIFLTSSIQGTSVIRVLKKHGLKSYGMKWKDGQRALVMPVAEGPGAWAAAKEAAEVFERKPTRLIWSLAGSSALRLFLCALTLRGFADESKRPLILMSGKYEEITSAYGDDFATRACQQNNQSNAVVCADAQMCNESQVKQMLEGSLFVGSNQLRKEIRENKNVPKHACTGKSMQSFVDALSHSAGPDMLTPLVYNIADAICMYAMALRSTVQSGSVQNYHSMSDAEFMAFERALAATDFEGLVGRIRYEVQNGVDRRFVDSHDENTPKLAGPDLFLSQYLVQHTNLKADGGRTMTRIADLELQSDGSTKVYVNDGAHLSLPGWKKESSAYQGASPSPVMVLLVGFALTFGLRSF
eukprot:TRINITY_DN30787_c0_g1_i1.p1 TRINITY_DN30787_c0_g1~~TRINITY_DN30787_c0_g1_i1.p1  ORF type:complete len:600 (+),score=40.35 TRINITY_DN30787_c0_g1_i1:266-1801(+)